MKTTLSNASQAELDAMRDSFRSAEPFPHIVFDSFLDPEEALRIAGSYPSFAAAREQGGTVFESVNERLKLQLTDSTQFPPEVLALHEELASPEFLRRVAHISGIDNLLADPKLGGGGIHQTGPHGRLDVHVDFNYLSEEQLHRRLNILVYFNEEWSEDWGGKLELWDEKVKVCHASLAPVLNRCVIFETSERSFHGVTQLSCPDDRARKSFAAYYYTAEAPAGWDGSKHSTIFKARPDEVFKGKVAMPVEKACRTVGESWRGLKSMVKGVIGRKD